MTERQTDLDEAGIPHDSSTPASPLKFSLSSPMRSAAVRNPQVLPPQPRRAKCPIVFTFHSPFFFFFSEEFKGLSI